MPKVTDYHLGIKINLDLMSRNYSCPRDYESRAKIFQVVSEHFRQAYEVTLGVHGVRVGLMVPTDTDLAALEKKRNECQLEIHELLNREPGLATGPIG